MKPQKQRMRWGWGPLKGAFIVEKALKGPSQKQGSYWKEHDFPMRAHWFPSRPIDYLLRKANRKKLVNGHAWKCSNLNQWQVPTIMRIPRMELSGVWILPPPAHPYPIQVCSQTQFYSVPSSGSNIARLWAPEGCQVSSKIPSRVWDSDEGWRECQSPEVKSNGLNL